MPHVGARGFPWDKRDQLWWVSQQLPGSRQKYTSFPASRWTAEGFLFEAVARALGEAKAVGFWPKSPTGRAGSQDDIGR